MNVSFYFVDKLRSAEICLQGEQRNNKGLQDAITRQSVSLREKGKQGIKFSHY